MARPLRLAFIAGLVDTDGSIDKRGVLQFGFCNKELTYDIRDLLVSVGIQANNVRYHRYDASCLPQKGTKEYYDNWSFVCSSALKVAAIPFVDAKYRERVNANLHRYRPDGFDCNKAGLSAELGFYAISSIKELPAADVYDIEVEDGHSFVADGVVVHNSNYQESMTAAYHHNIVPTGDSYCTKLTKTFRWDAMRQQGEPGFLAPNERLAFDYSLVEAMQENRDAKHIRYREDFAKGVCTRYEAKQKLGYAADPERDDVYIQDLAAAQQQTALDAQSEQQQAALGAKPADVGARVRKAIAVTAGWADGSHS